MRRMLQNSRGQFIAELPIIRFLRLIRISETGCWEWVGTVTNKGYGRFRNGNKFIGAHQFAYKYFVGNIKKGLTIDHLCRNRRCVNPDHLELVSNRDNVLRGEGVTAQNARKTHCPQGHPYDLLNTHINPSGGRVCRICGRIARRKKLEVVTW